MKNKTPLFVYLAFSIFFIACEESQNIPADFTDPCDHYIGAYEILPVSFDKIPYNNKDKVVFVDSFGNEVRLNITFTETFNSTEAIVKGNPDNEADKIYYCYHQDKRVYNLIGDSTPFRITLTLEASPYYNAPREGYIADEITVRIYETKPGYSTNVGIFNKILDQRSFPEGNQYLITEPIYTCLGKSFSNAQRGYNIGIQGSEVYYSDMFGIICFNGLNGHTWRFERFE